MLKFFPIDHGHVIGIINNMVALSWRAPRTTVTADFIHDDLDNWFRVEFESVEIIRILDDMPLSTEQDWESAEGHVNGHFAYRVEGAHFWLSQSEAFRACYYNSRHYRFLTDETCLDVVSQQAPRFSLIPARWDELD